MRLLLALAVVALALVAWLAFTPRRAARNTEIATGSLPAASRDHAAAEATRLESIEDRATPTRSAESAPADASSPAVAPLCRAFGRVIDERGVPIGQVHVTWRELDAQNVELCRIKFVTNADGRFEFTVPLPTSESQRLSFFSSEYRAALEHAFGTLKGVTTRKLVAGDNDLGDFTLEPRGVVAGRVLSDSGMPVEGVALALDGAGGQSGTGLSGPDGRFLIMHGRPGTASVIVRTREWTARTRPVVDVAAGVTTNAPDIVVFETPTIQGVVTDAAGVPLEKITVLSVSLRGDPVYAKAQSDKLGAFTLYVSGEGPFTLEVKPVGEFIGWGGRRDDPACTFEPGFRAVGIVLERAPHMTFRIVDAQSRAPIERFGLRVIERTGPNAVSKQVQQEIALEHHPQGEMQLPVRGESMVAVAAQGFADVEVPVAADPGSSAVQTIALLRPSGIAGRIVLKDKPIAGANVRLRRETSSASATAASNTSSLMDRMRTDRVPFPGRPRAVGTSEDGRFAFTSLAAGTYALEIEGAGGGRKQLGALQVLPEQVLQVGDIALESEALVRVVVKPGPNQSPIGYRITMDVSGTLRVSDPDGSCTFRGLAAGPHWIVWEHPDEKRGASSTDRRRIDFDLRAGETREIVIDAASSAPCKLTVRVLRHGTPVPDVFVNARTERNPVTLATEWRPIGQTDARGVATGTVEGGVRVEIEVLSNAKRVIGVGAKPLDLVAGGNVETTVELASGRIVVELPATLARPELGSVMLTFPNDVARTSIAVTGQPRSLDEFPYQPVWATSSIDFGEAPVGRHPIRLQFQRFVHEAGSDDPKAGKWIALREPFETTVEVKDGEITRVVVP